MYGFELSGKDRKKNASTPSAAKSGAANNNAQKQMRRAKSIGNALTKAALNRFGKDGDSRSRMQAFINMPGEVPAEVVEALKSGKARMVDHTFFSCQDAADVVKFFMSGDEKTPGVSNLKGNTIPKGYGFLVSKVTFRVGEAASSSEQDKKQTKYDNMLNAIKGGHTGFVRFSAQNRAILQEMGTSSFVTMLSTQEDYGTYHLDNPRYIGDNGEISLEVQFPSITGTPANTRIMVELKGSMIVPQ